MADQQEPKASFPRQEVSEGQVHGYIGNVEMTEPPEPGDSNVKSVKAPSGDKAKSAPEDKAIAGSTGTLKRDES